MKKIIAGLIIIILVACQQGVRVENEFVDEIQVLAGLSGNTNNLKVIGHKSGQDYVPTIDAVSGFTGDISQILMEEDDLFILYSDEQSIVSLDEKEYTLRKSYDISNLGKPLDMNFPNTSNGYFTVDGKDTIYILDRISQQIASIRIPIDGQPNQITSKGNKLYISNLERNVLTVVATNTKEIITEIELPGMAKKIGFRDDSDELLAVCKLETEQAFAVYINTLNNSIIEDVELPVAQSADKFPEIISLEITPAKFDYAWVGTDQGVYRLDLRLKQSVQFYSIGRRVLNIFYNSRPIDNEMFYLGELENGTKIIETVDPTRFTSISNVVLEEDTQIIYPFF